MRLLSGLFTLSAFILATLALAMFLPSLTGGGSIILAPLILLLIGGATIISLSRRRRRRDQIDTAKREERRDNDYPGFEVYCGVGADVLFNGTLVCIRRHGSASFLIHGLKGDKRIPVGSVTAVQFREASQQLSGYVQFSILGGVESRGGIWDASKDENTVLFSYDQNAAFICLRDRVEQCTGTRALPVASSLADELGKLADLHQRGVLDATEFTHQKARLLQRAG